MPIATKNSSDKLFDRKSSIYSLGILGAFCGIGSQQPYGIWPLMFISFYILFYLCENYRLTKNQHYKFSIILLWVLYSGLLCNWISFFGPLAFIAFLAVQAVFMYIFVNVYARIVIGYPVLVFAIGVVSFEWVLAHLGEFAFGWMTFSTTLVNTPFIFIARGAGGAGITFALVVISASSYDIYKAYRANSLRQYLVSGSVAVASIFVIVALTFMHFPGAHVKRSVAIVQGNDKNRYLTTQELSQHYLENSHIELAKTINKPVDYLIFPESSFSDDPLETPRLSQKLQSISHKANRLIILNTISTTPQGDFNRNFFFSPSMKLLGTYDKKHLVPFGEYVPAKKVIGSWSIFDEIGTGFIPGRNDVTIDNVTTLICFESAFSSDVRNAINDQTHLLVITTNNRSYRRSGNSAQHLAQSQLRAAEYGIPVVHASVSGISAIIDSSGHVYERSNLFENIVLKGDIDTHKPDSFYYKTGDWLSLVSIFVVVLLSLISLRKFQWKSLILRK